MLSIRDKSFDKLHNIKYTIMLQFYLCLVKVLERF